MHYDCLESAHGGELGDCFGCVLRCIDDIDTSPAEISSSGM